MIMLTLLMLLGIGVVIYQIVRSNAAKRRLSVSDASPSGTVAATHTRTGVSPTSTIVLLTTGDVLPGRKIAQILDIVTYDGGGFGEGVQQLLQGSSTQEMLNQMRKSCLHGLRNEAAELGADAVVCVRISPFYYLGSVLRVSASGTAVRTAGVGVGEATAEGEVGTAQAVS